MTRFAQFALLLSILCCFCTPTFAQQTIYVDDNAPTDPGPGDPSVSDPNEDGSAAHPFDAIQEGINTAVNGDEVVVADGTYTGVGNRDIDFNGKAITVRGASGDPNTCVIDCEGAGRGFYFHCNETAWSIVEGFTVTNGHAKFGAGVYCSGTTSPRLANCRIMNNLASHSGGGVFCDDGRPTITDSSITDNRALHAGGVYTSGSAKIVRCLITANTATERRARGGGIALRSNEHTNTYPVVIDCVIVGNSARHGGGIGVYSGLWRYCFPTITNCTISGNTAPADGGGIYCYAGCNPCANYPVVSGCLILGNEAGRHGGGIYVENCNRVGYARFSDCLIAANSAAEMGGAVYCHRYVEPTITGCTIVGNSAGQCAGATYFSYVIDATIANTILWGDSAPQGTEIGLGETQTTLEILYSDVAGGQVQVHIDIPASLVWGAGNIDTDPLFVDPDGPDNDPNTWEDNNYRLSAGSPCIDAGDPNFLPEPGETDLDGHIRVYDGNADGAPRVDMGAYEFVRLGDLNCDGIVDYDDVDAFVLALIDEAAYYALYPDGDHLLADLNGDGAVNSLDIDPFIALLSGE